MKKISYLTFVFLLLSPLHRAHGAASGKPPSGFKPNIIIILADDLGYGDVGCFGQKLIKTPNIDRLAAEGMRFTQAYCGTSVCSPSRCALMTGLDMGHAPIRANRSVPPEGQEPLPKGTITVAGILKGAGYETACIGKWGLGFFGTGGDPLRNGFDYFYGYNDQTLAHNYYPESLWKNSEKIKLDGKTYSQDLIAGEALEWVSARREKPFFLFWALTLPHVRLQIPDLGAYAKESWTKPAKTYAAMVTRMDTDIGRLLEQLKKQGIDDQTIVFFASDNGPEDPSLVKFFRSQRDLRGLKRDMGEGSLRTPSIVRWPGKIKPAIVNTEPWAFWDFLPTCVDLAHTTMPTGLKPNGVSIVNGLFGGSIPKRDYFYWELHEEVQGFNQAVRFGDWKAIRPSANAPIELYDLSTDPGERKNLAGSRPEQLATAKRLLETSRVDSPVWPINVLPKKGKK